MLEYLTPSTKSLYYFPHELQSMYILSFFLLGPKVCLHTYKVLVDIVYLLRTEGKSLYKYGNPNLTQ
jgi:hypothetical protein